eukprot:5317715-Pyramimonas_sp.AAC.1
MIQDEKARKEGLSAKGASGSSCCAACKNVYYGKHVTLPPDQYIGHASLMMPERFDLHTNETMWEMADELTAMRPTAPVGEWKIKQQ